MLVRRRSEAGFSLVEGLVAMLLLLVVVLGILPLFPQSMALNLAGRQFSQASSLTHDGLDVLLQLPLDNELLTIPDGDYGLALVQVLAGRNARAPEGEPIQQHRILETYTTGISQRTNPEPKELLQQAVAAGVVTSTHLDNTAWIRVAIVRQFRITSLSDGVISGIDTRLDDEEQLPGGTDPGEIHLKKIDITLLPRGENEFLTQPKLRASLIKTF